MVAETNSSESSDNEIKKKKKKKKLVIESSSEGKDSSESSDNEIKKKKKKKLVIESSDEKRDSSEASGNEPVKPVKRIKKMVVKSSDEGRDSPEASYKEPVKKRKRMEKRVIKLSEKERKSSESTNTKKSDSYTPTKSESDDSERTHFPNHSQFLKSSFFKENLKKKSNPYIFERNQYRTESATLIENEYCDEDDYNFIASDEEYRHKIKSKRQKKKTKKRSKLEVDTLIEKKKLRSREKQQNDRLEKLKTFRLINKLPFNERLNLKNKFNSCDSSSEDEQSICTEQGSNNTDEEFIDDNSIDNISESHSPVSSISDNVEETLLTEEELFFFKNVSINNFTAIEEALKIKQFQNLININGQTALHIAAFNGYSEMTDILLNYGSSPDLTDHKQFQPLAYAALNKHFNCFKILFPITKLNLKKNVLHLLSSKCLFNRYFLTDFLNCLAFLQEYQLDNFYKYLNETDDQGYTPIMTAIDNGLSEVVKALLKLTFDLHQYNWFEFRTDEGGTLLHFSSRFSSFCLEEVLPYFKDYIDFTDLNGFTPLMYASEVGSADSVRLLLKYGASVNKKDKNGVTALHLATASGAVNSVQTLLEFGHQVDCLDEYGWPPLLYANFQNDENLVLILLSQNPKQIFCLGRLLLDDYSEKKEKNAQVIREVFLSLSHIDSYYTLFNEFIASNLSLLDENNNTVFASTWRTILSFKNKLNWMRMKTDLLLNQYHSVLVIDRNNIVESAMSQLPEYFSLFNMSIQFKGEMGSCLGPKREFVESFVKQISSPEMKLLHKGDNNCYIPISNSYSLYQVKELPEYSVFKQQLEKRLQIICFFGKVLAQVVLSEECNISLQIATVLVKQLLGKVDSGFINDLKSFDHFFYSTIKDNSLDELKESFSVEHENCWTGKLEEVFLDDDMEKLITDSNKDEYLDRVAKFKMFTSIKKEIDVFKQGFFSHIPADVISIFNVDEFSLLLNGVTKIDVQDWKKHTLYKDLNEQSTVIKWFWKAVEDMIEEEKTLLLKFCTASPCVPVGGFSNFKGLGGSNWFTIQKYYGKDKLPEASTCFNTLRLPDYSSEKILRKNLLIAVRHGNEGFAFV
ncbi:uncharacterized protein LOC101238367 isoform X2 [Hydra vulgaris]|uniref:uncharacterized protein LOC101238367 isoform X2 n=1 Tax=Hydra vulgaris TaxID=6087 RepID=UPI001F5F977D|nr:uncharacterized protein LOC101238367 isoform X2 [Hydra vulgaris]